MRLVRELQADPYGLAGRYAFGRKRHQLGPPAEGRDVIFKHGEIFIAARVTWATEADAGLEFYRKLPPGDLVKMLQLIPNPPQA